MSEDEPAEAITVAEPELHRWMLATAIKTKLLVVAEILRGIDRDRVVAIREGAEFRRRLKALMEQLENDLIEPFDDLATPNRFGAKL